MDYLVRAAVADVDRFQEETDAGTRIFIRQLIEMHASNLAIECENMRLVGELCNSLEAIVNGGPARCHNHHGRLGRRRMSQPSRGITGQRLPSWA